MTNIFVPTASTRLGLTLEPEHLTYEQILHVGRVLNVVQQSSTKENVAGLQYSTACELLSQDSTLAALAALGENMEDVYTHRMITFYSLDLNDCIMTHINVRAVPTVVGNKVQGYELESYGSNEVQNVSMNINEYGATAELKVLDNDAYITMDFTSFHSDLTQNVDDLYPCFNEIVKLNRAAEGAAWFMVHANGRTPGILELVR